MDFSSIATLQYYRSERARMRLSMTWAIGYGLDTNSLSNSPPSADVAETSASLRAQKGRTTPSRPKGTRSPSFDGLPRSNTFVLEPTAISTARALIRIISAPRRCAHTRRAAWHCSGCAIRGGCTDLRRGCRRSWVTVSAGCGRYAIGLRR